MAPLLDSTVQRVEVGLPETVLSHFPALGDQLLVLAVIGAVDTATISSTDLPRGEALAVELQTAGLLAATASLLHRLAGLRNYGSVGFLAIHAGADVVQFEGFRGLRRLQFGVLLSEGDSLHFRAKDVVVGAGLAVQLFRRVWNIADRIDVLHGHQGLPVGKGFRQTVQIDQATPGLNTAWCG